jgi:hypothetical protein
MNKGFLRADLKLSYQEESPNGELEKVTQYGRIYFQQG